jgi:hypothetical protein
MWPNCVTTTRRGVRTCDACAGQKRRAAEPAGCADGGGAQPHHGACSPGAVGVVRHRASMVHARPLAAAMQPCPWLPRRLRHLQMEAADAKRAAAAQALGAGVQLLLLLARCVCVCRPPGPATARTCCLHPRKSCHSVHAVVLCRDVLGACRFTLGLPDAEVALLSSCLTPVLHDGPEVRRGESWWAAATHGCRPSHEAACSGLALHLPHTRSSTGRRSPRPP